MFLNLSGWREFLETSGPGLAFIILCSVGSILMLWGAAKERQGLVLIGLLLGGLAIPTIMIDWNIFNGIMALLLFLILIASAMVYSSMSAVKNVKNKSVALPSSTRRSMKTEARIRF